MIRNGIDLTNYNINRNYAVEVAEHISSSYNEGFEDQYEIVGNGNSDDDFLII